MNDDYRYGYDNPYGERGRGVYDARIRLREPAMGYYPDPWFEQYRRAYPGPPVIMTSGDYHSQLASHAHYRGASNMPVSGYAYNSVPNARHEYMQERGDSSRQHEPNRRERSSEKRHKHKSSKHRRKRSKHRDEKSRKSKRSPPLDNSSSDEDNLPTLDHSSLTLGAEVRGKAMRRGDGHSTNSGSEVGRKSKKRTRSRTPSYDRDAKRLSQNGPSRSRSSSASSPKKKKVPTATLR